MTQMQREKSNNQKHEKESKTPLPNSSQGGVTSAANTSDEKAESGYPRPIRVIALVAAVFLVMMYVITLIAGLTTSPAYPNLFKICLSASILIPIVLWGYVVLVKIFGRGRK
jgi:hypothetical protein